MATPHQPHQPNQIPIKIAARKLPVKRKVPDGPTPSNSNPNPISDLNLYLPSRPKLEEPLAAPAAAALSYSSDDADDLNNKPPPFKFHRIWPESDEIRFLQGLLDSAADGLVFPRDLNVFYDRFSQTMPQPYTRSQLSEKLRRLRKKFRVVSARLSRGLDASLLTPHDRSLLHISKQLWHPAFAASSPFSPSTYQRKPPSSSRVNFRVSDGSPAPPLSAAADPNSQNSPSPPLNGNDDGFNVEDDFLSTPCSGGGSRGMRKGMAKTVMDVFDQSLNETRMTLVHSGLLFPDGVANTERGKAGDLEKKWREQRVRELDVLARRLRLVLEHAVRE